MIASAGELLVEFVATDMDGHHLRPTRYAGPFPSGAPGIFIDQVARVGGRALFVGAVGQDAFGQVICGRLGEAGVSLDLVRSVPLPTGSAFVAYNSDGSRDFVFNIAHSAAARFEAGEDTFRALLDSGVTLFHISGSSLGDPDMRARLLELAETLHKAGVSISFDPNLRKELIGDAGYLSAVAALQGISTFFLPSDEDAAVLFPGLAFEAFAKMLLGEGVQYVVQKRGDRGCIGLSVGGEWAEFTAHKVDVVDPTGAGDCFCATFVTLMQSGRFGFAEALARANAAGALAVTKLGPMEGNSSLTEIEGLLALAR